MGSAAAFEMKVALLSAAFGGSFALGADLDVLEGLVRSKK
jgi:hypothetical protein